MKRIVLVVLIVALGLGAAGAGCAYVARGLNLVGSAAGNAVHLPPAAGYSSTNRVSPLTY